MHESNGKRCPGAGTRRVAGATGNGSQQVKDRVKDGAQVGRAWPPTRLGCREVRGDPGPGGVVEIGVVVSGAHCPVMAQMSPASLREGQLLKHPLTCLACRSNPNLIASGLAFASSS